MLIVCPACQGGATAKLVPLNPPAKAGFLLAREEGRMFCTACGHNEIRPAFVRRVNAAMDSVFCFPLWLTAPCCGHTLWAYNAQHLAAIEHYVASGLRERVQSSEWGWYSKAWESRLPKWVKAAKNREAVLRAVAKIRKERLR